VLFNVDWVSHDRFLSLEIDPPYRRIGGDTSKKLIAIPRPLGCFSSPEISGAEKGTGGSFMGTDGIPKDAGKSGCPGANSLLPINGEHNARKPVKCASLQFPENNRCLPLVPT